MKKMIALFGICLPLGTILTLSLVTKENAIEKFHVDGVDMVNYSVNPPAQRTGAPGETNCTSCHNDGTAGSAGGVIDFTFSGSGNNYYPGETYDLTLTYASAGVKNGFEMTILDGADDQAGTLIAGTNSSVTTSGGRQYIRHSVSIGISSWSFQWTAPATDVGDIRVYFAGAAANNADGNQNDNIYIGQDLLTPAADVGISKFELLEAAFKVSTNAETGNVELNYEVLDANLIKLNVTDLNGRLIQHFDFGVQTPGKYKETLEINQSTPAGLYMVSIFLGNEVFDKKVYLD